MTNSKIKHSMKPFPSNAYPINKLKIKKKWITTGLKASIHHKDNLYKKYLLKPTTENKTNYSKFLNHLTTYLRQAEDLYYRDLITSGNQNLYKLWNIFGQVINPQKYISKNRISPLNFNSKTLTNDPEIADALN